MIEILIADDHAIVREGLKQIITENHGMAVTGEARSGREVLEMASKKNYDVLVLDITMPGTNVLDVIKQLKSEKPRMPILVLSMHPEDQYAVRVLKAGASGYLTKESAPDELVTAIRKISSGGKYISDTLAEKLVRSLNDKHDERPHERLSDREFQVFSMISAGKIVKEIAETLNLSEKTISTYRSRILEKMKLSNNAELTHYAFKHKLID